MTESDEERSRRTLGRRVWRGLIRREDSLRLPPITLFDLQYKEKAPDFSFPKHSHERHFEIYYVDRGRVRYSIKGAPWRPLEGQQALFLPPKLVHEIQGDPSTATNVITLHFDSPELLRRVPELRVASGQAFRFDAEFSACLDRLCALARAGKTKAGWSVSARLYALLARLSELAKEGALVPSRGAKGAPIRASERLEAYIKAHLQARLDLASLALAMGCSVSTLTHEYLGPRDRSPHAFIVRCRIERSKELLRHSQHSVKEIAILAGFSSQSAFGRSFRKLEKASPGAYRRSLSAAL